MVGDFLEYDQDDDTDGEVWDALVRAAYACGLEPEDEAEFALPNGRVLYRLSPIGD